MRKKIVKTVPMENAPRTEIIYYADGTKGLRGGQGVGNPQVNVAEDHGRSGRPLEWDRQATDGEPATHSEIVDMEKMLDNLKPAPSDYLPNPYGESLPLKGKK